MGVLGGAGIGNSTNLSTTDINEINNLSEQLFEQKQLNNSVNKLISSTMSKTISKNSSSLQALLKQTNSISITSPPEGCPPMGNISLKNITQRNVSDISAVSKTVNDITTSLAKEMKKDINKNIAQAASYSDKENLGSTFGEVAGKAFETIGGAISDIADVVDGSGGGAGIGNKYNSDKMKKNLTNITNKYGLKEGLEVNEDDLEDLSLNDELSNENITAIITEVLQANGLDFNGLCPTNFEADTINQINESTIKVESETINKLSKQIADKFEKNFKTVMDKMLDKTTDKTVGDIAQLGVAAATTVTAGGDAVSKTVESGGKALSSITDSLGNIVKGPIMMAVIGIVIIAIIAGIIIYLNPDILNVFKSSPAQRGPPPMGPPPMGPPPMGPPPMQGPPMQGPPMQGPPMQAMMKYISNPLLLINEIKNFVKRN